MSCLIGTSLQKRVKSALARREEAERKSKGDAPSPLQISPLPSDPSQSMSMLLCHHTYVGSSPSPSAQYRVPSLPLPFVLYPPERVSTAVPPPASHESEPAVPSLSVKAARAAGRSKSAEGLVEAEEEASSSLSPRRGRLERMDEGAPARPEASRVRSQVQHCAVRGS